MSRHYHRHDHDARPEAVARQQADRCHVLMAEAEQRRDWGAVGEYRRLAASWLDVAERYERSRGLLHPCWACRRQVELGTDAYAVLVGIAAGRRYAHAECVARGLGGWPCDRCGASQNVVTEGPGCPRCDADEGWGR